MSYILEALKKAQAERQLGSAPDIHAPAPVHAAQPAAASRKPLLIGLSAGIVIAGVAGALAWRAQAPAGLQGQVQARTEAPAPAQAAPAAAPVAAPVPAAAQDSAAAPAPVPAPAMVAEAAPARAAGAPSKAAIPASAAASAGVPLPAAAPAPAVASRPAPAAPVAPAAVSAPSRTPAGGTALAARDVAVPATASSATNSATSAATSAAAAREIPGAVYLPAPSRAPEPAPVARAPEPIEEHLRTFQQLPDALQREIPRVSVGGYIYSPNPAERLLLVDKMLRREGEELAPGLVLERLMPKYAVMNYRGNRYRVGY